MEQTGLGLPSGVARARLVAEAFQERHCTPRIKFPEILRLGIWCPEGDVKGLRVHHGGINSQYRWLLKWLPAKCISNCIIRCE
jgi:hypothetical protein